MIREILKIRTDKGLGDKDPAFKDIEISEYSYKGSRMGMPELTATLMWGTCLDEEWTRKEYVMLNGERFYIRHTPSSSKSNTDSRYKHEINFTSEFAEILGNTYFVDAVPDEKSGIICQTKNKPCSNNTTFTFYGTISEFVDRLNCAFLYAGIGDSILKKKTSVTTNDAVSGDGYVAMLDPEGDYDREKSYEFSFEDNKLWEVLTEGYNITEIPFERRGRRIVFGAVPKVVSHKFEYGYDNELLSVNKNNANAQVINRISMLGSDENIPYYYPNETEYGHISVVAAPDNKVLGASNVVVNRRNTMLSDIREGSYIRLRKSSDAQAAVNVDNSKFYTGFFPLTNLEHTYPGDVKTYSYKQQPNNESTWYVRASFTLTKASIVKFTGLQGCIWSTNTGSAAIKNLIPSVTVARLNKSGESASLIDSCSRNADGTYDIGTLSAGSYEITFAIGFRRYYPEDMFFIVKSVNMRAEQKDGYYWEADGKKFDSLAKLGLSLNIGLSDTMVGDGFGWEASGRMPFQDHLMPSIYRSTLGAERFYNALNNTYTDPDTGEPYVFPNPFIEGSPSEYIYRNEEIKPTIEGITNADGKLFGEIVAIAYDSDDNDSLKSDATEENDKNDTLKYEHSFFYLKLNVFNGEYGFDLFSSASQTDPMTLQMVSGNCNGCKFKIQALEYEDSTGLKSYKNPVQTTGANGNIVEGSYDDKVKESWQEWQQNTQTHSIWICVQKDAETFGVIMPNQSHNFKPAIGDKFNIINIDLPQPYIDFAEKRLEEDGIRFMAENNEEKFTFDISASRIFFAENPDVLAQLDEYSKINVIYNGKVYEQYVNQFSIDCKDSEALPNIGIGLTDTLAVGQSFIDQVAEKASSLLRNPSGANGGVRGMTMAEADQRYLNKAQEDRTPFKLSSDIGFEVGEYVSGASGGIFFRDPDTGQTYIEADKLKIRMKAIFEELEIAKVSTIGGKFIITPGGGINISFVEELANSYRCYFKAKDEDKGAECRFVVGDQVQCHEFNIQAGTYQNASNRYYWRLVTAVNNDESYIELSKTDCDNALLKSDAPAIGDTIVQLGNRNDNTRQSAIILSTVDAFAPCVTLYNGIDRYSLDGKAVVEYGVDKTKNPPRPFFHCYGDMYIGAKDGSRFLQYTPEGGLIVRGSISSVSTIVDEYGNEIQIDKYVEDSAQSAADQAKAELQGKIDELQNQIDGVVETWSGDVDPTKGNYPASDWKTEYDKQAHIGDVYFNIGAYDSNKNPNAGHAWRWYYNSASDFGWIEIADSDAVRALQLAQMSVTDTDVLYIQTDSRTESPKLPTANVTTGAITNLNGWSTDAPEWKDSKYIWQCTYVKKGDGTVTFAEPTCISGKDGVNGTNITISSQSVRYSTSHTATQPADSTFTLPSVPTLSAGQYLWSMTTVTYSNGQSTKSYAVSRIGTNGTNGTSVTITSTSVRYAKSTVATQPADTSFTYTSIASAGLKLGEYLWTKTEVAYSDGSSTKSYSVSRIGSDGEDGLPGAPGEDGRTPYVHYAYANSADGKTGFSTTYFKDALYVGVCSDYTQADPTDYTKYEWSRLRGEDGTNAKSVVVSGEQIFAYTNNFTSAATPTSITLTATLQNTTSYQWSYKKEGATSFANISGATSATLAVAATNTTYFPTGAKSCTFRCTSGTVYDEITLVKVSSGTNGTNGTNGGKGDKGDKGDDAYTLVLTNESHIFMGDSLKAVSASIDCDIIAFKGVTKVNATIGTITGMPTGMTVKISNNGTQSAKFTVSVTDKLTKDVATSGTLNVPVTVDGKVFNRTFSWVLSLAGRGITAVVEEYAVNNSATTAPADSAFKTDMPTMTDTNRYLWNREKTTYTDNTSETTTAVVIGVCGQNGADGATVVSVTNYYLASAKASGVKNTDTGWQTDASHANATTDATKPYLWNYEVTKWSKGADTKTDPHVVGKFGKDGRTPKITEQYYLSTSSTQLSGGSWQDTKPTWIAGRYYWTRSKIDYGEGDIEYTEGICVTPENGTSVLAEYSADGTHWHPEYQSGDVWMHTGTDGKNWSPAIRIVGANYTPNLLKGADKKLDSANYGIGTYGWDNRPVVGTVCTLTICAKVGTTDSSIGIYQNSGYTVISSFTSKTEAIKSYKFTVTDNNSAPNNNIAFFHMPKDDNYDSGSYVKWAVVTIGDNTADSWIPAASEMVGQDGAWRKFQWAKTTSSTTAPASGWQDTPMTANAGEYVWMRSGTVYPPATNPTTWETATRVTGDKGEKGDPGSPAYMLDLTDEVKGIACDASGNPISSSIPTSQASVYKGSQKLTSGITYSIAQKTGITTATISSAGVVTLSGLTADTATIVVQAVVDGVTLQSTISVYKAKPGGSYAPNLLLGTKDVLFSQNSTSAINKSMKFNTVRNLKDYPAGTKLTLSFDYQYSSVSTATNFNTKRFGFQQPIKTVGTATSYIEGWMELPVNSTNISGEGTFKAIMTLPDGANVNVNEANFYIQLSKGNITLKNFKIEEGANDNPHWSPAASEMVGEDALVYQLEPSVDSITKSMTGELSEKSVTCSVYKTTGNSTRVLTSEKTLTCYRVKTDGTTQTTILGHANGTSAGQSVTDDTEALIFELTDGTTVLDRERVPVLSDASDLEIGGRNLLLRSGQGITTSSYLMKSFYLAVTPKVGDTYTLTLWGNLASTKTGFHIFNSGGMVKLTELKKISDGIYQSTFKWVKVSGSSTASDKYINIYAVSSSQSGTSVIERVKLEKGNVGSDWTPSPDDVEYLEDALKETTKIDGGLILTSAISLGQNNTDYTSQTTWSGISGIYNSNGTGGGIALWTGGDMLDKADYYNWDNANGSWVSKGGAIPSRIAKGVDRMDGSGYRADGNLWWDKDGNVTFVGNMVAKGEFAGIRKNSKTIITSANWKEYLKEDDGLYFINFKSLGCYAEFQYKPSGNVVFYMPEHKGYVGETVVFVNKSGEAIEIRGPLITQANFDAGSSANTNSYSVPNGSTIELRCRICVNSYTKQTRTVWIQQIGTNSNDYEYNF